jgi:uncharacterized protein (DUF2345 family)
MRHLLMDPAFPDIVGEWAEKEARDQARRSDGANDNHGQHPDSSDPLLALVARAEIEATRLW